MKREQNQRFDFMKWALNEYIWDLFVIYTFHMIVYNTGPLIWHSKIDLQPALFFQEMLPFVQRATQPTSPNATDFDL